MPAVITALGWVGAIVCLIAYIMVSQGKWAPGSGRYQLANVISGLFMGLVAASSGVWPSVVTNAVWALVGTHAVLTVLRARRQRARDRAEALASTVEQPVLPTQASAPAIESGVSLAA